ncbi:SixA phosphatase family protein [Sneathiella sp.]|jgi:phosphohistidine phosphatase|uniref:SixA phosphatase family protein n=1 Tax=Sneathiella sp. TaxID=1964365 RepID=UPI0039E6B196
MKRLTLLRHAKSSWNDGAIRDFERPLSPRGIKAAPLIGQYLRDQNLVPELILCSPAKRTRETLARTMPHLSVETKVIFDPMIYSAGMGGSILDLLPTVAEAYGHVLIIGHNPTMQELALTLTNWQEGTESLRQKLTRKFSTCAVASLEFDIACWNKAKTSGGLITHFMTPKMLTVTG